MFAYSLALCENKGRTWQRLGQSAEPRMTFWSTLTMEEVIKDWFWESIQKVGIIKGNEVTETITPKHTKNQGLLDEEKHSEPELT